MMSGEDITIIIPVYNRVDLLRDCLDSLGRQSCSGFRLMVVDDASQEDVASCVMDAAPDALFIRRDENGGFARAVNDGLRRAETPLVFLLNSDMTLEPDCLERLADGLLDSGAAMACPLVLFRDDPDIIYSAGDTIRRGGRPESIGFRRPLAGFTYDRHPFGVSAGAALYRREIFDTVGLFDETFVAYFEDADLCMRARAAGFRAACVPEAVAYHVGSASLAGNTLWRTRQCYLNHALLVRKHYSGARYWRELPWILRERLHQTRRLLSANRAEGGARFALAEWRAARRELAVALRRVSRASHPRESDAHLEHSTKEQTAARL
jgi:GT2 family glycosyltransferase